MALLEFENLPSTNTPISAENLNNNFTYSNPVGGVQAYAGSTAPNGYLLCDGQAVSRTTYADLFNVIGTTYGTGDGSTTFNVPNLKGKVLVGYNSSETEFNTLGKTDGEKKHSLTTAEMPTHNHQLWDAAGGNVTFPAYTSKSNSNTGGSVTTAWGSVTTYAGEGQPHNILQPYLVMNYIIKY